MKDFNSFFYLKKKIRIKNLKTTSIFLLKKKKKKFDMENSFLSILKNKLQKNTEKVMQYFKLTQYKKRKNKKIFSNKKNKFKKFFNIEITNFIQYAFYKAYEIKLNWLTLNQLSTSISIKIEIIFNFSLIIQNFYQILINTLQKWQKNFFTFLCSFQVPHFKQEKINLFFYFKNLSFFLSYFDNFVKQKKLNIEKFFLFFYGHNFIKGLTFFNFFKDLSFYYFFHLSFFYFSFCKKKFLFFNKYLEYFFHKKFLKKKLGFAQFFFQILLKNTKKILKTCINKFFLNNKVLKKNLTFLFIHLFLELQVYLFFILRSFQKKKEFFSTFFTKKNSKIKCYSVFSFFLRTRIGTIKKNKKKILDFFFTLCFKKKKSNLNFYQKLFEHKRIKIRIKKFLLFPKTIYLLFNTQIKKSINLNLWNLYWKNFYEFFVENNSKLSYQSNIEKNFYFLILQNTLKITKIFYIFFYFSKKNSLLSFKKKTQNNFLQNISYLKKLEKKFLFKNLKLSKNFFNFEANKKKKPTRFHKSLGFKKYNTFKIIEKKIFFVFYKFIKKNTQIFFEYFCLLTCLKSLFDFSENSNDFNILSHQQCKFSFSSFQKEKQSLIYCDFLTFFDFLKVFSTRNFKQENFFLKNIYQQFIPIYLKNHISNFYKIDQFYLFNDLKKCFCETNIQNFLNLVRKKLFYSQKKIALLSFQQTNKYRMNQSFVFDILFILFKFFYCDFVKILYHFFNSLKLEQIKICFFNKYKFSSLLRIIDFKNHFCIKKKCFKHYILKPIHFFFKHYYDNFVIFSSRFYLFFYGKKFHKYIKNFLIKNWIFEDCFLNNSKIVRFFRKILLFKKIPLIHLFKIFYLNICKKQNGILYFLHFQKMFWLISKKIFLKSTKINKKYFFCFSTFFSSSLIQKLQDFILYQQKKYRKNTVYIKNFFHINFEGFSIYFYSIYKKKSKVIFYYQKNKTQLNVKLHLKQCRQILKNSIGQKQLFFMKILQTKIKVWCKRYKKSIDNRQEDSKFLKVSLKNIFYYCDLILLKYLWDWALKTHPNKSKLWIKKKYFHFIHSKKWFFGKKIGKFFVCLPLHSQTQV